MFFSGLTTRQLAARFWGYECNGDVTPICPRAARYTVIPQEKNVKRRREKTVICAECGVSALVHATPGATASRFAGRSTNRTTPITRNTITSVKFLWTP